MRVAAAIVFSLIFPLAGLAAEEPEAVYAKFHRSAASGDLEEMVRHAHQAQRAEFTAMSAAQKSANAKMMAALLPRAYLLQNKTVNPDGQSARLLVSGQAASLLGGKPEMMYGSIRMVMERGEWKVGGMDWSNTPPAGPMQVKPAASPPVPKAQTAPATKAQAAPAGPKAAPVARGPAPVGAMSGAPEPKLGAAKPTCVYKPVMTNADIEACR